MGATINNYESIPLTIPKNGKKLEDNNWEQDRKELCRWKTAAILSMILALASIFLYADSMDPSTTQQNRWSLRSFRKQKCQFCDQPPPILHLDESYTLQSNGAVVTPMTIVFEYELYDGQMVSTNPRVEHIPNLDSDYAILALTEVRNLNRDTNEPVSLDEVYVHHFDIFPLNMLGAEALSRSSKNPNMQLPEGYALHVTVEDNPNIRTNAHLLSNKNLAPLNGSIALAHKECNECYYGPTKGSDCTPEVSGTFSCCGDSLACILGGEDCACPTTTFTTSKKTTTKYKIEIDLLISRDIDKFRRLDQWNFGAPACHGDGVFEEYSPDNFCSNVTTATVGGASLFHSVEENNAEPFAKTSVSVVAPSGGKILWAQSHLHTGGVNATLYQNGAVVCATRTRYGNNSDPTTNARNEQNHLVEIDSCYDQLPTGGIVFEEGDVFTTETIYGVGTDDTNMEAAVAGEHKNVMSMFFMAVEFHGNSKYFTKKRTSFNKWNNFVPDLEYSKKKK